MDANSGPHTPGAARTVVGLVGGALAASIGALVLGEYPFTGATPWLGGVLFGLVVGELVATVAKRRSGVLGAAAAAMTAGGLLWAVWISSGEGLRPLPQTLWPSMALGAVVAGMRAGLWPSRPRGVGRDEVSPAASDQDG